MKAFCLGSLLCISQYVYSESFALRVTENTYFEIVGTDIKSTQFVHKLSDYVAKTSLKELSEENYLPARKILVQLLNEETSFKVSQYYELSISELGFVTLSVSWNESLSLPSMIEALTAAFLQSFGYSSFGEVFLQKYPSKAWLVKGLSQHIYLSLRPNVFRLFFQQAIFEDFESDDFNASLFNINTPSDAQSFFLYRFIKNNQFSVKERMRIFKQALLGKDVLHSIYTSLNFDSEEALRNNISDFLSSQSNSHTGQFESLATSQSWLQALGDFSSIEIESTEAKNNSLHLLWENRADPSVVQFIQARIRLISLALNQINPLYYNAAQSLALTYQKILDGVEEWELLYYFSDFLNELDQANAVSLQISKQLSLKLP